MIGDTRAAVDEGPFSDRPLSLIESELQLIAEAVEATNFSVNQLLERLRSVTTPAKTATEERVVDSDSEYESVSPMGQELMRLRRAILRMQGQVDDTQRRLEI